METLFDWVMTSVLPWAKKVLVGLGFGVGTYTAVNAAVTSAVDTVVAQWSGFSPSVAAMLSLFGLNTFIGIVLGAIVARLAIGFVARLMMVGS